MKGHSLLDTLVEATGLPEQPVQNELHRLLERSNISSQELDLEQLRALLADYVQEVLLDAKKAY